MDKTVNHFIDRSCSRKVGFKDEWQAMFRAEKYGLQYYKCECCGKFHLCKNKLGKQWEKDYLGGNN